MSVASGRKAPTRDDWLRCLCGKKAYYDPGLGFNGFKTGGWRCGHCGEEYYDPEKAELIFLLNKLRKRGFDVKLNKVRSNLILRIPKAVGEALRLSSGDSVELRLNDQNEIVVRAKG